MSVELTSEREMVEAIQAQIPTPMISKNLNLLPCTVCSEVKTWGIISSRPCVDCLISSCSHPAKYNMLVTALKNRNVIIDSILGANCE